METNIIMILSMISFRNEYQYILNNRIQNKALSEIQKFYVMSF